MSLFVIYNTKIMKQNYVIEVLHIKLLSFIRDMGKSQISQNSLRSARSKICFH